MGQVGDAFEPGPQPPLPEAPKHNSLLVLIWLASLIAVLLIVAIVVLLIDDESGVVVDAPTTTEGNLVSETTTPTTIAAPAMTTAAPATTAAATTTAAPATTAAATTTAAPAPTSTLEQLQGDTATKNCPGVFPEVGRVIDITFEKISNYTRIIFYFEGQPTPGCELGYIDDPSELRVTVFAVPVLGETWVPGIFDPGGYLDIGLGSVLGVDSGGQGGGSGEWSFVVELTGTKDFAFEGTVDPSRLIIDIAD